MFGAVKRRVRMFNQFVLLRRRFRIARHADGYGDVDDRGILSGMAIVRNVLANPLGRGIGLRQFAMRQNHCKLFSAASADDIRATAQQFQLAAQRLQDLVARNVAVCIVNMLEVVNINEQNRQRIAGVNCRSIVFVE